MKEQHCSLVIRTKNLAISAATWLTQLSTTLTVVELGWETEKLLATKYHCPPHAKSAIRQASTVRHEEHGQQ